MSPSLILSPDLSVRSRSTRVPLRNVPLAEPQSFSSQHPFAGMISACLRDRYRSLIGIVHSDARPIVIGSCFGRSRRTGEAAARKTVTSALVARNSWVNL